MILEKTHLLANVLLALLAVLVIVAIYAALRRK